MNKRIKRKIAKGKKWFHKGQMLWQHHSYQRDIRSREVMMLYDPEFGCEYYFKDWKDAKKYLRQYKLPILPPAVRCTIVQGEGSFFITDVDNIPF